MEWTTLGLILAVLVLLVLLFVKYMTASHNTFKKMGIESPPTAWCLGNFVEGIKYGIFEVQTHFYNQFKGKQVYGYYDSHTPVMVIRDLDMIKDMCIKNFNQFVDRRVFQALSEPQMTDNLLNLKGEHWKRVRSTVSPTFSSGRIKKMSKHVEKNSKILVDKLREKQEKNEELDLSDISYNFTLNVIASTGFGLDINALDDPNNRFAIEAKKLINFSPVLALIGIVFPSLAKLLSKFGMSSLSKTSLEFFASIIDSAMSSRKEDGEAGKVNDFLDLVINLEKEEGQTKSGGLTRSEIHGQALLFLFAGYDTVASVLSFTLFHLAMHPESCRKVQEEIDAKLGKASPNYDNVQELTYLDMCVNETMRLYPPGIFLDRVCTESTTIQGVEIPQGMIVMFPLYAIQRDEENWPEPEKFDPERFSPENKTTHHPFAYNPFGQGPRNCIGMRLGLLELRVAIASVLQHFDLHPCSKTVYPIKLSKMDLKANDGLWVKLEARK